jgi:hypothetical protein
MFLGAFSNINWNGLKWDFIRHDISILQRRIEKCISPIKKLKKIKLICYVILHKKTAFPKNLSKFSNTCTLMANTIAGP